MTVQIRNVGPEDLAGVERLLQHVGLPTAGLPDHQEDFVVADDGGRLVATAGLELYGTAALLRSVAVDDDYRKRGIAGDLVQRLLDRAAARGVSEVYLLTTTAAGYFRRFGFEPIGRDAVRPEVTVSAEFGDACCATAQTMRLWVGVRAR